MVLVKLQITVPSVKMIILGEERQFTNRPHRTLGFYLLLLVFSPAMAYNVYWEVQTHPVVFGESVTLYCNTSSVQDKCDQCTKIWYGGTNQELLSFNGHPVNPSRHETTADSDGFALIIKNFEEEDFEWYSCAYGFFYHNKELKLTDHLEIQPTNETSSITQFIDSESMLNVQVDFKKVHPPPRCNIFLNGDNLSSQLITKQHQEGIFYRVTVEFQHNLQPYHCVHRIKLDCTIGTKNKTIISSDLANLCTDDYKNEQSQPLTTVIVELSQPSTKRIVEQSQPSTEVIDVLICSVFVSIAIIIIVLVVLRYCRQSLMRRNNNSNAQKGSSKAESTEVQKSLI